MNWKLILLLSLLGLAMGLATLSLIPTSIEPFCWLAVYLLCAFLIARYAPGKYFLHGLCVSLVNCIWVTAAHGLFFAAYATSHPEYLRTIAQLPPEYAAHPLRMMILIGPISGVMFGIILGLFAWVASKIVKRPAASE
jgi:hypothetical protein